MSKLDRFYKKLNKIKWPYTYFYYKMLLWSEKTRIKEQEDGND